MRVFTSLLFVHASLAAITCTAQTRMSSPDGHMKLSVFQYTDGRLGYKLEQDATVVMDSSQLGISIKEKGDLLTGFTIKSIDSAFKDMTWATVWGEESEIRDLHKTLIVHARHSNSHVLLDIEFRLFNDGLGFRYIFPQQETLRNFTVTNELTTFHLTDNHTAWWIPGDYDTNEYYYTKSRLSNVDAQKASIKMAEIATRTVIDKSVVQAPLMLKTDNGLYIHIFEAALVNYPAMHLRIGEDNQTLTSQLVPDAVGNMAYLNAPCHTPWRTIIASKQATDILASRIILNLNEPCALTETDWIKPMKFVGVWWEMHVGVSSWEYSNDRNIQLQTTDWNALKPNGHHGATTENTKRYIDFAAANGIDAVLVEGWNVGWEDWFGNWKENVFDFVTPYPDFDVAAVEAYAKEKGVQMIMHHETSASVTNYERRLQEAMTFMQTHHYPAVKTGYVGRIIPRGEWHDGQWMVNHYVYVAQEMAKRHLMVDAHEPVRPTGLHRTYPNWLACEAARGNEFNAWSQGNPPEHETILPFTRLMGGPMDYTPGIFEIKMSAYGQQTGNQVHTTLAKQLALYVTMYSPLQMAADLPQNYELHLDAFQFIKDVPVDWQKTLYLEAEPGEFITIARKQKNTQDWYLGAITNSDGRSTKIALNFLDPGKVYKATVYADAPDADWKKNPTAYVITEQMVRSNSVLDLKLAPGGGAAVSIKAVEEN